MFTMPRSLISAGALGAACALLVGCGSSAPGPAATRTASAAAATQAAGHGTFSHPLAVDNPMFPLAVGTQFTYQGKIVQDGESKPHSVTFTVTDVSKVVDGVQTVVAWDRDFLEGKLQEQEGMAFGRELVLRGARERLAPILMTSLATGLALVPLVVLGTRPGHEIEHPLAVVILGGLFTSTLLSLFVLPSLYLRFGHRRRGAAVPGAPAPSTSETGGNP